MKRILIVNADDANLTPGVNRAILDCHDRGIVTSTTFLINLPVDEKTVRSFLQKKMLGIGLHLNVTMGGPVSRPDGVRSLLRGDGRFRPAPQQRDRLPRLQHLVTEYRNQIKKFRQFFGRLPTHLDTHHQVHDHPFFLRAAKMAAEPYRLALRRSAPMLRTSWTGRAPDYLFGNLRPEGHWRMESLAAVLRNLPAGTSEIACHPGENDAALRAVSSFTQGREAEKKLLMDLAVKKMIFENSIRLSHYGLCYTCSRNCKGHGMLHKRCLE